MDGQKIILLVSLFLLVGVVLVGALSTSVATEIEISKGWNLISMQAEHYSSSDSFKFSDFKYVYIYDPENKEYLLVIYNGQEIENVEPRSGFILEQYNKVMNFGNSLRSRGLEQTYTSQTAVWAYSEKDGKISYQSESQSLISLNTGWNFVGITPEMDGKSIDDIKGTCDVEKAYLFDFVGVNQRWATIFNLLDDKNVLKNEGKIGGGFIVKVSDDCVFDQNLISGSVEPPLLPD